ncbi:ubiquinol-cytochrome c reductase iron-sulfur subunit [Zafaria sp. Z1313]|uniref:QcrA and Rieske domain-containing protein n=1 Tax=unclassified Zafaria TaxID=2828765 RepID=UPI002E77C35C|nr:Rieske (2Fe-2S) protein [Zafaria sp. J156]MEE1620121.1 Rieske (2Fe-2S) protein [Zafaria sp. J156]
MTRTETPRPARRTVLGTSVAAGGAAFLAACGSASPAEVPSAPAGGGAEGTQAATLSELPEGASLSVQVEGRAYLLYRPDAETVLAYRAVCTHAGCEVLTGETQFECPCHGSRFAHADGAVTGGPANRPLERFAAAIDGDDVLIYL